MNELTVGSLFSGIGGFDLGLERAGMRVLWQCDNDPYALRVLAKHWPSVLRVPDIRGVNASTVPGVDVICGGFPCQDISVAGKGAGLDGERSGLWFEYARVIGELRPRYVIVENVRALVVRGLDVVLGTLAALGYDAEWDCIPASAVGAPHQRDRVWLVAYPQRDELRQQPGRRGGESGAGAPLVAVDGAPRALAHAELSRLEGQWADPGESQVTELGDRRALAQPEGERRGAQRPRGPVKTRADADLAATGGHWKVEPDVGRVADGVPARVDRLRALGNALVPQIAEWIGRRIIEWEGLT